MAKKIVIKVANNCGKDKKGIMKSVAKLEGIDEMKLEIDKGTLTIIGDVDPVCVIKALRKKCGICAEIESIGPPKPPEPPKKPNPEKPNPGKTNPPPAGPPPSWLPPCNPPMCYIGPCPPRHCDCDRNSCQIL